MNRLFCAAICCLFTLSPVLPVEPKNRVAAGGKCRIPEVKTAYANSDAVFAGDVLSVNKRGNEKIIELRVKKYWKGVKNKRVKISVYETARYQAWFETGKSYLVFARKAADGNLHDGRCSGTKLLSEASKDIKELGRAKLPR